MDEDIKRTLQEAAIFQSLVQHPGWRILVEKLDLMVADATANLTKVAPTKVDEVLAAHRDWKAVYEVRQILLDYVSNTITVADDLRKGAIENGDDSNRTQ